MIARGKEDSPFPITLLAHAPNGDPRLASTHEQIWVMLGLKDQSATPLLYAGTVVQLTILLFCRGCCECRGGTAE